MSSKTSSVREMFDEMSLNVTSFLQSHAGVARLSFSERGPVPTNGIIAWERANHPLVLPEDFRAFLQISDGVQLKWDVKMMAETAPLGCMHLNQLGSVNEIKLDYLQEDWPWMEMMMGHGDLIKHESPTLSSITPEQWQAMRAARQTYRAFDLDCTCTSGKVALLYCQGPKNPQVWFQDLSCRWYFLCRTFSDFFRLVVMHLGIPNWYYAFTEVGLHTSAKQWIRYLSPERLAIDQEGFEALNLRRRAFRGEMVIATPEAEGEKFKEDVTEGSGEQCEAEGVVALDLASLDQMRDSKNKKKPAEPSQVPPKERWAQASTNSVHNKPWKGDGLDDAAANGRKGSRDPDRKSTRPTSASSSEDVSRASTRPQNSESRRQDSAPAAVLAGSSEGPRVAPGASAMRPVSALPRKKP